MAEIERELANPAGNEMELVKRADFLVEAEVRAMAAEQRRRAVLEGLARLGYEVSEGMATAWVKDGEWSCERPPARGTVSNYQADPSRIFSR